MIEFLRRGWAWLSRALDYTGRLFAGFTDWLIGVSISGMLLVSSFRVITGRALPQDSGDWPVQLFGSGIFTVCLWISIAYLRTALLWLWRQFRIGTAVS
jgi:hypothetical protein